MSPTQNSKPNGTAPANTASKGTNFLLIGLGATGIFLLLTVVIWLFAGKEISGTEFCPQTFQLRRFEYRRYAIVGTRFSSLKTTAAKLSVSTSVLQYLKTIPESNWDIVDVTDSYNTDIRSATILVNSLGTFWDRWSDDHPELAKVLWPAIQLAAIQGHYVLVPEMLETALEDHSDAELQDKLTAIREKANSTAH